MQRLLPFFTLASVIVLSGCGGSSVGQTLGLERKVPDEFQVLSRPPLSIPPEFNLQPPTDGSEGGGLVAPAYRQAEEAVFGADGSSVNLQRGSGPNAVMPVEISAGASTTDQNFLNRAGASIADPNIRKTIREENGELGYEEEKSIIDKLHEPFDGEPMVDAEKEAERIKKNTEEGKPIDEGDTETKMPKDRGVLGKFNEIF